MQRAEEIIAEVYRQLSAARERGMKPDRVIMLSSSWTFIKEYRRSLGIVDGPMPDYLSDDSLFGLEIWYGNEPEIRVE